MTGGLGIDIGTSSVSSIRTDIPGGVSLTLKNDCHIGGKPWENLQDPDGIMKKVLEIVDTSSDGDIGSVGLSGQMHGILYYDKEGKAVSPLYTWQDGRGNLPFRDGLSYAGWLSRLTGYSLSTGFGAVTHFFNVMNGLVPPDAVGFCTIMDYAAMVLTGARRPLADPSNAASLGFFDLGSGRFDFNAVEKAGMDPGFFPEVSPDITVVGTYKGIPVVAAIGDNQAAYIGSVPYPDRSIHVTVGTSSQISVRTDTYSSAPGIDTRPLPGGCYIMVGAALCGGSSIALLNNFFRRVVESFTGSDIPEEALYGMMNSVHFTPRSGGGLDVKTKFRGTREQPSGRGSIGNISMSNLTPEELVLGFNRGIADELFGFFEKMPEPVRNGKDRLVGSGNAVRRNELLRLSLEERFGCGLTVSVCTEEAALGACICGLVGAGEVSSPEDYWKQGISE